MAQSQANELARREARAQHGIIEFAEEMQAIRDGNMYPNAGETRGGKIEPWATYCKERWGMSKSTVDEHIKALPVLKRYSSRDMSRELRPSVTAASRVATLPEPVQDAILAESPRRNDASDKAKAVRKEAKRIVEQEGREPTDDELVAVAQAQPKPQKKPKHKKHSKFTRALEQAYYFVEQAADIAQGDTLTDVENDYGWNRVAKVKYQLSRIEERLYRPEVIRDADEEFAELLNGTDDES